MSDMDKKLQQCLAMYCAAGGVSLTDEQRDMASNFTVPTFCFAPPGSGKSTTVIAGLIMARTFYEIPGDKINAMSFTRAATANLAASYNKMCKKQGMSPKVNFNTFHSICKSILDADFGQRVIKIESHIDWDFICKNISQFAKEAGYGYYDDFYKMKSIYKCICELNSSFTYDRDSVLESYSFKSLEMSVEQFQDIRKQWFTLGLLRKTIQIGDIPLYALYSLLRKPALQRLYKEKYEIMLVDEFQDMSILHLKILSMISGNLVVMGDMDQQIYGFNGACHEIVGEYFKLYPNARKCILTESFRCRQEIADYSTNIILRNHYDEEIESFVGTGDGGHVDIMRADELPVKDIVSKIKEEEEEFGFYNAPTHMFLFRNNISTTPIIEELFQQGILFRTSKFKRVMDMDLFRQLTWYIDVAIHPGDFEHLKKLTWIIPELKGQDANNCPFLNFMNSHRYTLYKAAKEFGFEYQSTKEIINDLWRINELYKKKAKARALYDIALRLFDTYYLEGKWWKMDMKPDEYFGLVACIIDNKDYDTMIEEENSKSGKALKAQEMGMGVRCYTCHSAKGLEADNIYILDVDSNIFPNSKEIRRLVDADCSFEAAKHIRDERNLLYVAITRAISSVIISYTGELSELINSPMSNDYDDLDDVYANRNKNTDEIAAFYVLYNVEEEN